MGEKMRRRDAKAIVNGLIVISNVTPRRWVINEPLLGRDHITQRAEEIPYEAKVGLKARKG